MVNSVEDRSNELREVLNTFIEFLKTSKGSMSNGEELKAFANYVFKTANYVEEQLIKLDKTTSGFVHSEIGAVCRYYAEFDWRHDKEFRNEVDNFLRRLIEKSGEIYDSFGERVVEEDSEVGPFTIVERFDPSDKYLEGMEKILGLKLPESYREFLNKYGAGIPNKNRYYKKLDSDEEYDFNIRAFYGERPEEYWFDLNSRYGMSLTSIPEGYLPIADDGYENYIAIGLEGDKLDKVFIMYDDEVEVLSDIDLLENSLEDFINRLQ